MPNKGNIQLTWCHIDTNILDQPHPLSSANENSKSDTASSRILYLLIVRAPTIRQRIPTIAMSTMYYAKVKPTILQQ